MERSNRFIGRLGCILAAAVTIAGAARGYAQAPVAEIDAAPAEADAGTPSAPPSAADPDAGPTDDGQPTDEVTDGDVADGGAAADVGAVSAAETEEQDASESATDDDDSESDDEEEAVAGDGTPTADTGIRGRVVDANTGQGLPDVVVIAQGQRSVENAITSETGGYVLVVPQGRYSVLSYTDLYHGARMPRVVVRSGRWSDLTLTLEPIDGEAVVEEVEIVYRADTSSAAAQDQLRAASTGIAEGMGSQQMSRSGASDAGSAARNVVGVTLEGTNLNIRGLGGRYTLVLLNGVQLPSTDPDVPSVDLDLFPTAVIDSLQISKAFLPDMPGNFAGGVLDIRTVRFPREFTFQLGVGAGVNTQSSFDDRLTYAGGDLDWLGFDDGSRALPDIGSDRLTVSRSGPYTSSDQLETLAERFPNRWQYERRSPYPNIGLDLTLGDSIDLGDHRRLGYLVTAQYGIDLDRSVGPSVPGVGADGSERGRFTSENVTEEVQLVTLGTASLELGQDDVISFLTLFTNSSADLTSVQRGINTNFDSAPIERWQLQMITRRLWFNHLRGDHRNMFGSRLRLRWGLFGSYGGRSEPDRRTVTYGPAGSQSFRWLEKAQSGERFYSELEQLDFGGTLDLRFPLWTEAFGSIGGMIRTSGRDFSNRRFRMVQDPSNTDGSVYELPAEDLFGEEGIGTWTRIREFTSDNDSYVSRQSYYAAYAMLETPIAGPLSLTTGARFEAFEQELSSFSPLAGENDPDSMEGTDRTDFDVLPAANLRLEIAEGMVLRGGYSMTVARPNIRELAPYQYYDFVRDRNVQGNPDLQRTLIQNADLRWEWFFGTGQILALSAFYKFFDQPIELQILDPETYGAQYRNGGQAHLVGGEAELRVNLGQIAEPLRMFDVGGSIALVWSEVEVPLTGATRASRPLFNQAPYVASVSLRFNEPDSGVEASLIYNVVGPRLTTVGVRTSDVILPDQYSLPFHSLDFVMGWRIDEHFRLRLKAKNLLFQTQREAQGVVLTRDFDPGMSVSLSLGYTY